MLKLLARRALALLPLLLGITFLTFLLLESSSGDFFSRLLEDPQVSEEQVAMLRRDFGLDRPFLERYAHWLVNACQGNLGRSFRYHLPVGGLIMERLGNTLLLALASLLLSWGMAVPLGVLAALRPRGLVDRAVGMLAYLALSMPRVFLALLALLLAAGSGIFPVGGMHDQVFWDDWGPWQKTWDLARHLALPATVLALTSLAGIMRQMRGSMIETLGQDYIRTARAKGLPERVVVFKHALRNAINPMVTLFGYSLAHLVTGSFLVEVVFSWPGLARLTMEALLGKDLYLVMASVLVVSLTLVLGNLSADLMLAAADPRVRAE